MSTLVTEREMSTHPLSSEGVVAPRGCFERLLVPVDFSPASRAALQVAGDLSARYGSEIVVFNAAGLDQNDAFLNSTGVPWGRGDVVRDVREHLRRFTETVLGPGAERVALVDAMDEEDVVRAVAVACVRNHATLLVIGTRTDDARRWRRSAAERIARSVAVPVLTVPVEPSAASRAPFD